MPGLSLENDKSGKVGGLTSGSSPAQELTKERVVHGDLPGVCSYGQHLPRVRH